MAERPFVKGLENIGTDTWAYVQPDGSWGWSNSGLIVDGEDSLLVDTLFDERLTAEMLSVMQKSTGIGAGDITTLVNTHANGDHTFGNRLVANAEIIASEACKEEMADLPPQTVHAMLQNADSMGDAGAFIREIFAPFHFDGIELAMPTRTFRGNLELHVGGRPVQLMEVGPAHTRGDTLVYVPDQKVIYTGDILFVGGTPIIWAGPVENWISACNLILDLDVDVVVPGHGPVTDKRGAQQVRDYLEYILAETRRRFDDGMPVERAVEDIALAGFGSWSDAERIVVNVHALYGQFAGDLPEEPDMVDLFGRMARYRKHRMHGHHMHAH